MTTPARLNIFLDRIETSELNNGNTVKKHAVPSTELKTGQKVIVNSAQGEMETTIVDIQDVIGSQREKILTLTGLSDLLQ